MLTSLFPQKHKIVGIVIFDTDEKQSELGVSRESTQHKEVAREEVNKLRTTKLYIMESCRYYHETVYMGIRKIVLISEDILI